MFDIRFFEAVYVNNILQNIENCALIGRILSEIVPDSIISIDGIEYIINDKKYIYENDIMHVDMVLSRKGINEEE